MSGPRLRHDRPPDEWSKVRLNPTRVAAGIGALGVTAAASLAITAPADAVEVKTGIGRGQALVYIESPTATVIKTGKNSYRMFMPPNSTGQWMGERTDGKGKTSTRVGDITAKKLSNKWSSFRYTSASVPSTLAWASSDGMTSRLVKLSRPTITDSGVRFDFTSPFAIPSTLTDVSINLQRAPKKSQARTPSANPAAATSTDDYNFQVTGDLWIGSNAPYANQINSRVYNASNNNTCWTGGGAKVMNDDDKGNVYSVTSNTCANVAYENAVAATSSIDAYGASVDWPDRGSGSLSYFLYVTPQGAAQFKFTHQVMSFS